MVETAVALHDVSKTFTHVVAVNELSLNVPRGPRKATDKACSSARHAEISSVNRWPIASAGNGPGFADRRRAMTCASRSGR